MTIATDETRRTKVRPTPIEQMPAAETTRPATIEFPPQSTMPVAPNVERPARQNVSDALRPRVRGDAPTAETIVLAEMDHGTIDEQVNRACSRMHDHSELAREFFRPSDMAYMRSYIHSLRSRDFRTAKNFASSPDPEYIKARLTDAKDYFWRTWPRLLKDQKRLDECTGEEIRPLSIEEQNMANGHTAKALFYGKLAKAAQKKRIGKVLTAEQAAKLWAESEAEAKGPCSN